MHVNICPSNRLNKVSTFEPEFRATLVAFLGQKVVAPSNPSPAVLVVHTIADPCFVLQSFLSNTIVIITILRITVRKLIKPPVKASQVLSRTVRECKFDSENIAVIL